MMSISMYRASVPVFKRMLGNLDRILDKAAAYAQERKIEPTVLLHARLAPDMFHLIRQVQIATDQAKGTVARLAGEEPPKYEDSEASFADLKDRIARTIAFLDSVPEAKLEGSDTREVALPVGGQTMKFKGLDYLLGFGTPNVYFHVTTAYAILRHNGLAIGKGDFIGGR
jgi:uncharacterized protein